ncbi:MAG: UDP-N-acetylmuramoyl-tripeptide--D-alanyl-D-alanine ligase [Planctomycetota bacterium]|jgi:UDP-N-acetylmuramoyl-tripeptide--D-alanyl-D-alanine ligase
MSVFRLANFVDATGALSISGDHQTELSGLCTDSRSLKPGELFVALDGPNFLGNNYARAAVKAGAGAVVLKADAKVDPEELQALIDGDDALRTQCPIVTHPNPRRALGDFGGWYRSTLAAKVIGITGSCGKTTTKSILVKLLESSMRTVGSPRSYNNDIGVPLTLALANEDTEALVVEMGTNSPGEIAGLCRIARPDIGLITNIGASHLEGLGSLEGVAHEKADLARSLPREGFLVVNADCRFSKTLRSETSAEVLSFSINGEGDLNATDVFFHSGGTVCRINGHDVSFPLLGTHNVQNCLAALSVGIGLGLELEQMLPALSSLKGGRQRMERFDLEDLTVFDDSYNSNPESARAAVRVLAGLHGFNRRVFVFGDMLELGQHADEMHREVGREAMTAGIDCLIGVGALAEETVLAARQLGLAKEFALHFPDTQSALENLGTHLQPFDAVLIKGSRGMALEQLVQRLRKDHKVQSKVTLSTESRDARAREGVRG